MENQKKTAMFYIEAALREKIKSKCPGYGEGITNTVVAASLKNNANGVTKQTLIRAIELAMEEKA